MKKTPLTVALFASIAACGSAYALQEDDFFSNPLLQTSFGQRTVATQPRNVNINSAGADPLQLYWNFNDSGVAAGQPPSALALQSDTTAVPPPAQGTTSTINLTGFNGGTGVTMSSTATTANLAPGDATGAGQSLSFSAAAGNNGKFFTFTAVGTALQNFMLSEAVRSTDTGFGSITLSYSTNGSTFTTLGTDTITRSTAGGFNTITFDLSSANATLANAPSITFKETFNTVTGSTGGNTQIDNIQLGATAVPVPEPTTYLGGALAVLALCGMQRKRIVSLIGRA